MMGFSCLRFTNTLLASIAEKYYNCPKFWCIAHKKVSEQKKYLIKNTIDPIRFFALP